MAFAYYVVRMILCLHGLDFEIGLGSVRLSAS